jgi:uncharacterized protein involved in exopolysaccharide biosynthesis
MAGKYLDDDIFEDSVQRSADSQQDNIDLGKYFHLLLGNWKKILLWAFIGSLFGIMIGFSKPKVYVSSAVVAPELVTRGSSSGLSSLASLAGFNMNTLAMTDAMHPDLYPEIIKSQNFMIDLFDMPVTFATRDSLVHTDLYDYMLNYTRTPWWGVIFGFPHVAVGWVKGLFEKEDPIDDAEGHENLSRVKLTKQQERVAIALSKSVSATVEKKTYVLKIKVKMQDRVIAAEVANRIIENLKSFVITYRAEKAKESVDYYKVVEEETLAEYLKAQREYSRYVDSHKGFVMQSSMVEQQRLQNIANLKFQMYNQTAQNLLMARAKVQLEAPVLVVIQPGMAPHKGSPSKVKLAMLWFILGALVCSGVLCWKAD